MFVVSKRNIIVPSQDSSKEFCLYKNFMGEVPAWVSKTPYFKSLVNDGKIVVSKSKKDADVDAAMTAAASAEEKAKASAKEKSGEGDAAADNGSNSTAEE